MPCYEIQLTFVEEIETANDTAAEQYARKLGRAYDGDAAHSLLDLDGVEVTECD